MPDTFGAITGTIGAICGIYGAIMGHRGYKRSNAIKALDLRMDLRKGLGDAHALVRSLEKLLHHADASRRSTLAATGMAQSGAATAWEQALIADQQKIENVASVLCPEQQDFSDYSPERLESELVRLHRYKGRLDAVEKKYRAALESDEDTSRHLRQVAANRVSRSMGI